MALIKKTQDRFLICKNRYKIFAFTLDCTEVCPNVILISSEWLSKIRSYVLQIYTYKCSYNRNSKYRQITRKSFLPS